VATIDSYVEPSRLYRYRSLDEFNRELDAIETGYLFCAAFTTLNDPMEGNFSSSRNLRKSENYHAVREAILSNKSRIGMCSFSEVHNHELMWAHYADQFRGICVGYNFSKLRRHLPEGLSFVRMFYNETEPVIHRSKKSIDDQARMILSYKSYKWLYEREWRMFAPLGPALYGNTASVTSIYLGSRITANHRAEMMNRLRRLNIKTYSMAVKKYAISFKRDSRS